MKQFYKQLIFILLAVAVIASGALAIYSATPSGFIKIKPSLTAKVKMVNQENTTTTSNNPVGWWKMDEGTGQYAYDVSGNGNTGTLGTSTSAEPADPTWTTGKLGKGLSFDGVDDYVNAGSGASINSAISAITLSAWIKPNNVAVIGNVLFKCRLSCTGGGYSAGRWNVRISPGGILQMEIYFSPGNYPADFYTLASVAGSITTGTWQYVVATFNGSIMRIYINGLLVNTRDVGNKTIVADDNLSVLLGSGKIDTAEPEYFPGIIDDVRIYNRALSAGEVGQMYNSTKDGYLGKIKVSTGLVGYWKLDDNNALTSVIDYSGKGNTGTAYSGTATSTSVLSTSTAMVGRAMGFDGGDDYVRVVSASVSSAINSKIFTYSAWIKANNTTVNQFLFEQGRAASGYRVVDCKIYSNQLICEAWDASSEIMNISTAFTDTASFHHIILSSDGTNARLYIDGLLKNTVAWTGSYVIAQNNFYIGSNSSLTEGGSPGGGVYFNGLIDEVKIWNYARTAEQIGQDYQRGLKGLP